MTTAVRNGQVLDELGRPVPGASIYVYNFDGTAAALTSDGITPVTQPLNTDQFGNYAYYALVGYYREDTWYAGKLRFRENNIALGSPGADLALRSDLAATGGAGLLGFLQAGTGAVARTLQSKARDRLHVADFGAVGDGTTDDKAAIQKAIDQAGARGGGDVYMDALTYKVLSTVDIKYPRVRLIGTGAETVHDSGTPANRTRILAPFAGTSLKIRTPYAAEQGVTAANTLKYSGSGCLGIMLDGGGVGTKAVEVDSVSNVNVDVYATGYVGTDVYEVKCGVTGTDLGEACDVQYSRLIFRARQIATAGEKASNILRLSGSSNANVSGNRGPHHGIFVYAQHWDGHCLVGVSADNNDIAVNGFRVGGAGKLIDGKGKTAALAIGFDNNRIVFVSGQGAITQEGTDTAGVTAASVNVISARDASNGTPAPTAGTGSRWLDIGSDGVTSGAINAKVAIGDTAASALLAYGNLGSETLRIRNGSNNHVVLTDGTNTWGLNLDSSGNLRAVRVAGTGLFNIGASVSVPASGLINAANDAAAATAGVAVNQVYRNGSALQVRVS